MPLSHWGWGRDEAHPPYEEIRAGAPGLVAHLGFGSEEPEQPVPLEAAELPEPRVAVPRELAAFASASAYDRALCAHGRSYADVVRGFRGRFPWAPDFVVRPRDEREAERVLGWCAEAGVACTPRGGGTSVVGGVDARPGAQHAGAVVLALDAFDRVLEVDRTSLAARIGAGARGPRLEEQLAADGLTLRFYPQSFEFATLGGWIATRAGGHFATGPTHIDDVVESVRALTPAGGVWESRRLPASGAGPSPDRMLLGSEGTLGVITEAWVRVLPRPTERRSASVRFAAGFAAGAEAVRAILQDGLRPSNCRLIDPGEARLTFAGDGSHALLVLGFESAGRPLDADLARALELCRAAGGEWDEAKAGGGDGAGAWRDAFLKAPYIRDTLVAIGVLSETFETAITWDRLPAFCETVIGEVTELLRRECGGGQVTVRLTHAYPDGAAPYFTCVAPATRGEEASQWAALKTAAGEVVHRCGGTITHHHAVGRDHRAWYDRQRPEPFARALAAVKRELDPAGILNPGVLLGPVEPLGAGRPQATAQGR